MLVPKLSENSGDGIHREPTTFSGELPYGESWLLGIKVDEIARRVQHVNARLSGEQLERDEQISLLNEALSDATSVTGRAYATCADEGSVCQNHRTSTLVTMIAMPIEGVMATLDSDGEAVYLINCKDNLSCSQPLVSRLTDSVINFGPNEEVLVS